MADSPRKPIIHDARVTFTKQDIIVPRKPISDIFVIAMELMALPGQFAGIAITEHGDLVGSAVGDKEQIRYRLIHPSSSKHHRYWKACPFGYALHDCLDTPPDEAAAWPELRNALERYKALSNMHATDHWIDREPGR